MKFIQLQFDSLLNLWCFKEKATQFEIEIISGKRLLIGELPDSLISLAIEQYNAQIFYLAPTYTSPYQFC
jgi:hypothetical protein